MVNEILAEVSARVNARTAELLPLVIKKMVARDSLGTCLRHDEYKYPYVKAQINLTRAKRRFYNSEPWWPHASAYTNDDRDVAYQSFLRAEKIRDKARIKYHSTPCTCWVPKR